MNQAELPYTGTSGWSGTDTSYDRAVEADQSGKTSKRQTEVWALVDRRAGYGITVSELRSMVNEHHGTASGVLSVLHKAGKLERLAEKRQRCHVYVTPEHVNGRDTQPHGRRGMVTITREEYEFLRMHLPVE